MHNLGALILLGGKNSRMGGKKKAFMTYRGRTFLECVLESLSGISSIYLSVEDPKNYPEQRYVMLQDAIKGIGPMGGIYTGLKLCVEEALFVVACDMPKMNKEIIANLNDTWLTKKKPVVMVDSSGMMYPLAAIYTKSCLHSIEGLIANGDYRPREVFRQIDCEKILIEHDSFVLDAMDNINSMAEYERL